MKNAYFYKRMEELLKYDTQGVTISSQNGKKSHFCKQIFADNEPCWTEEVRKMRKHIFMEKA